METERTEPTSEPQPTPDPALPGIRPVSLIPEPGRSPSSSISEHEAESIWAAITAPWHPAVLAKAAALPRIEDAAAPNPPEPEDVRILAGGAEGWLASGHRTAVEDCGARWIEGESDRPALIRTFLELPNASGEFPPEAPERERLVNDFLALGAARWWLRDLTTAMGHAETLDLTSLEREVRAGALAWMAGDWPATTNRLRAAFELLTEARERFYPVDTYFVDLVLLDPNVPMDGLRSVLDARAASTVIAQADAVEALARQSPEMLAEVREAIEGGWLDIAGGAASESDEALLPLESVLWQYRQAITLYREHADGRTVETWARRRFGLYPQLPQIARRFGIRFGIHLGLDAGIFPIRPEAKRLWESPDGSNLEALLRPPLAADRAEAGLRLPWTLAETMREDHSSTMVCAHWPAPVAGWFEDLRRVSAYSPVLFRWTTLGDFFHLTDRPFESFRPRPDDYRSPYLEQAHTRGDERPISNRVRHLVVRARLEMLGWLTAFASALMARKPEIAEAEPNYGGLETHLETGHADVAQVFLDQRIPRFAEGLTDVILHPDLPGGPGYLVLNPTNLARKAPVLLPEAVAGMAPSGPLKATQLTEDGVWGVVELPPHGYAWVPQHNESSTVSPSPGRLAAKERRLLHDRMEVEFDAATGGLRAIGAAGEPMPRLAQQLVIVGLNGPSRMVGERFEVDYAGPALLQAWSEGKILGPEGDTVLCRFRQRVRLWAGRELLELDVTLSDPDPAWLASLSGSIDPWQTYLACRWAWSDQQATLRRTSLLGAFTTSAERPETPDAFEVLARQRRTTIAFGGLAHHRRHGPRMLDTLLLAGREVERSFRFGVALDQDHPHRVAAELLAQAVVVPTLAGPPHYGSSGWLLDVDHSAVAVTHVELVEDSGQGRGWGLILHLLETAGHPARCRIRAFRTPSWARQIDFLDQLVVDLSIDGESVLLDLTPHELARVDITLG